MTINLNELKRLLHRAYPPTAKIALKYKNPFELLAATILSAQCTDERVNKVTPALFAAWPDAAAFASAKQEEVEKAVRSTGFYKNKARSIVESSKTLVEKFGGKVPRTMEELLTLRGVARKTANVVLAGAFGLAEGVVVDTHVKRLAFRLGLSENRDPEKIEKDLMRLLPKKDWIWFANALILHGRKVCKAARPKCEDCFLSGVCPKRGVKTG